MAGFHPATKRRISYGIAAADKNGTKQQQSENNDIIDTPVIDNDDDEIEDFSDWDEPYHETAYNWYNRHSRRRARRLAGISSSSSSSESSSDDHECSGNESEDEELDSRNVENNKKRGDMDRAIRSANKPMEKWLASYPLVAARCCLSSISPAQIMHPMTQNEYGGNNYHGNAQQQQSSNVNIMGSREQETKKLHRIFRRLRRKQKEFHIKFVNNNANIASSTLEEQQQAATNTTKNKNSTYYQTSHALSVEQMMQINQDCGIETESDQYAVHSFIPQGIGISFIDAVLESSVLQQQQQQQQQQQHQTKSESVKEKTLSRLVLELNGPARSGQTSILLATAARYVASTCNLFLDIEYSDHGSSSSAPQDATIASEGQQQPQSARKRRKMHCDSSSSSSVLEPRVIILDLEKGVHAVKLILSVREAVLRRWDETAAARQWKKDQDKLWKMDTVRRDKEDEEEVQDDNNNNHGGEDLNTTTIDELRQIENAIASCLGRINIVQPRDFTYLSLVATIEALGQSLDEERIMDNNPVKTGSLKQPSPSFTNNTTEQHHHQQAPTLIMIDSLTTLDANTRFLESLPTSSSGIGTNRSSTMNSGLSDRNEFYRQLKSLREEHEVAIIATSRIVPSASNNGSNNQSSSRGGKRGGSSSLWEKMVSHRVSLHHVAQGTQEDQAGYDFVATLNTNGKQEGTSGVFPYSVTAGGILC